MTRMLCSLLLFVLISIQVTSCSLFNSSEEKSSSAEILEEGATTDTLLDPDAIDSELEDLAQSESFDDGSSTDFPEQSPSQFDSADSFSADEPSDDFDDFAAETVSDPMSEDNFAAEFEAAEFGGDFEDTQEGVAFSSTDESQVDPMLATDELNEFSDFDADADQFVMDAHPIQDDDFMSMEPQTTGAVSSAAMTADNQITNLGYKAYENGGTVVIDTASPAIYNVTTDKNLNQIVVQIDNVILPQRFKRPYITKDFKQDIATINAYQETGSNSAKVVIQMKRPVEPVVQKEGNSILVMTTVGDDPMAVAGNQVGEESLGDLVSNNQIDMSAVSTSSNQTATNLNTQSSVSQSVLNQGVSGSDGLMRNSLLESPSSNSLALGGSGYTGEKVSLEFTDTDIRTIIEVIAEKSGVNLIMDNDVGGKTSMRLRNVPWDQALVVMLRSQSLGYVKQGNVLRIAKQATLSKEAADVSAQIKNEKEAQLYSKGIKVKYIPVSYAKVESLAAKLKEFISKDGKIAFDERTSSLVITDYPEFIDRVRELVKALDTPPMQVEIAAKLVEAREEFMREAGINWDTTGSPFNAGSGRTGQINSSLSGGPDSSFSLDLSVGTFDIFGDLSASLGLFEQQSKVKVLSQPRIVTMNKTKASIKQTTQIPIQTIMPSLGVGAQPIPNITYQDLTLSLDVTPQITFKGDVILEVELQREFPGSAAENGQVEINTRSAQTTVMVKNGKTAVIGGIYQLDDIDRDSGIPWLKDIPLVGYLFKQIETVKNKNELLLFLKPKILKEAQGSVLGQSKVAPADSFDAFEELSIDEGSIEATGDSSSKSDSFGGEDSFDDAAFESEVF